VSPALRVRPLDPAKEQEIELVAQRMRSTLIEVLGEQQGTALYTLEWLRERVRFHLDPAQSEASILLAQLDEEIVGQSIVRRERDDEGRELGLMSTIYVVPEQRRAGVASALVDEVEAWMRARGLDRAATNTGKHNERLIRLMEARGYAITTRTSDMVQLSRSLA